MPPTTPLTVTRLGAEGDGGADTAAGPIYFPDGLPGETYVRDETGAFVRSGPPSPQRIAPVCRHFGQCGGCVAQHMAPALYAEWKSRLLRAPFDAAGLDVAFAPLSIVDPGSRRRAALRATVDGNVVRLGFHRRRSHDLVDLAMCQVLAPTIVAALPALREVARAVSRLRTRRRASDEVRIDIAALDGGLDVAVSAAGGAADAALSARLGAIARAGGFARLTVDGHLLAQITEPRLPTVAGAIALPPGAFFQAVGTAEARMTELVTAGIGKAKRVADLFSGAGTFTLPLARRARVLAVDSDQVALRALAKAARMASGLKPIETRLRDLSGEPLSPLELAEFDAVVLDPPRAGAKAQCESIARSALRRAVLVSCNPQTLARDCRILVDAGFKPDPVHGIDQFLWSPHIEAVLTLTREKRSA